MSAWSHIICVVVPVHIFVSSGVDVVREKEEDGRRGKSILVTKRWWERGFDTMNVGTFLDKELRFCLGGRHVTPSRHQ